MTNDSIYDRDMQRNAANFIPLSPLSFLRRTADVFPLRTAVVDGSTTRTWADTYSRCKQLASALSKRGIGTGDTVAVMAPNTAVLLEAHFGVPMCGAVLNALNTRLDSDAIAFILQHGEARVLICDREYSSVVRSAIAKLVRPILVIDADDGLAADDELIGELNYEQLLEEGDANYEWSLPQDEWDELPADERAVMKARQGVRYEVQEEFTVADPETFEPVPHDGETMGELVFRGNAVMKGYLKNPDTTAECFKGGYFWTGDLGVVHPDKYVEIRDRSKDIIISGGENISSIEVEEALYQHASVSEAAVVARPDAKWGESPCAFITLRAGTTATEEEIIEHCRSKLARFKCPKTIVFAELPKTSTGKIQKFVLRDRARDL